MTIEDIVKGILPEELSITAIEPKSERTI